MGTGELDRRVRRTQARLRAAIVELVHDKGFQAVTVDHLCERADVTRATFYVHFRDKEHLLSAVVDDLVDRCLDRFAASGATEDHRGERLVVLFEEARQHHQAFVIVLRGEADGAALRRLRARLADIVSDALGDTTGHLRAEPRVPLDVVTHLLVGEILGLLAWWVEHDDAEADAHQVVTWLRSTSIYGRHWALGVDDELLSAPPAAAYRAGLPPKEDS
jgi:AcrR family transcriptional regulator